MRRRRIPPGVVALGLVSLLMDTSSELNHGLLPAFMSTAYGFFNLMSGLAMLIASVVAGLLWDRLGAPFTFVAGAGFSAVTLLVIATGAGSSRRRT